MELLLQNGIIMERQGKILFIFNCQASTYFIAIYCWRVYKAEALYKRWNWHFDTNSTRFDRNSVIFFIGRNFDNRISYAECIKRTILTNILLIFKKKRKRLPSAEKNIMLSMELQISFHTLIPTMFHYLLFLSVF